MATGDGIHGTFMTLRGSLARAVAGIVPPRDVEDIVQETYVRACQTGSSREIRAPRSFLLKVARNLALDHVKRAESRLSVALDDASLSPMAGPDRPADSTFDEVASNEEFALFCEAVRHLPVQCRRIFVLKKVYGHSQREIAKRLNLSEHTVETQIARGMKRCTYFMQRSPADTTQVDGRRAANAAAGPRPIRTPRGRKL